MTRRRFEDWVIDHSVQYLVAVHVVALAAWLGLLWWLL